MSKYFEIEFGSTKIKFFPLTIGQIQELEEEMKAMGERGTNPFDPIRFAKMARLYTASARRGDPNVTEEMVKSVVDLSNIVEINRAVMGQFGPPTVTDPAAAGEAPIPTSPLNGGSSTHA